MLVTSDLDTISLDDKKALKEILCEAYLDDNYWCKLIFPEIFRSEFDHEWREISRFLSDPKIQRGVILAPRGFGKTSYILNCFMAKRICFRDSHFISYTSKSADVAMLNLEGLKLNIASNARLYKLFGPLNETEINLEDVAIGLAESFSKKSWVAYNHCVVMPRGAKQQHRGLQYRGYRPNPMVLDDGEDKDLIESEVYRAKYKQWFWGDYVEATPKYGEPYKIIVADTLKHEDSICMDLLSNSDWEHLVVDLCEDTPDGDIVSRLPNYMSTIEVRTKRDQLEASGQGDVFAREFRNKPISSKHAAFKKEHFRYSFDMADHMRDFVQGGTTGEQTTSSCAAMQGFVIVDPAKTLNPLSAETAIVGVSVNPTIPRIYIRRVDASRIKPEEMYERALTMADDIRASVIAIEVTSLHLYVSQPFKDFLSTRNRSDIEFVELNARGKKEERIRGLIPYYNQHIIYHVIGECGRLEEQLKGFPRSKLMDVMDAAAYLIQMLNYLGISLIPTTQPLHSYRQQQENIEEEYRGLPDPIYDIELTYEPDLEAV